MGNNKNTLEMDMGVQECTSSSSSHQGLLMSEKIILIYIYIRRFIKNLTADRK